MLRTLGIDMLCGCLFVAAWYYICLQINRRRSIKIVYWIDNALSGTARIAALEWLTPSNFQIRLGYREDCFKRALIKVQLRPLELPFSWLMTRIRHSRETITFEADMTNAPSFTMHIQEQRWSGHTRRASSAALKNCQFEKLGPFVLMTKREWQPNIISVMDSLVSSNRCEILNVDFKPDTPHFSATMPLNNLRPDSPHRDDLFTVMRELAMSAAPRYSDLG